MSSFLIEYLLDMYQSKRIFLSLTILNIFGLRDITLNSRLNFVCPAIRKTYVQVPSFKDRFFLEIKQTSYQEIKQLVFSTKYESRVKPEEEGVSMPDLDFKILVYLFVLCTMLSNSYYIVDHQLLSFVEDLNFENNPWEVDVHKEIINELDRCKAKLNESGAIWQRRGRVKRKGCVYGGGTLIHHKFSLEHIPVLRST